MPREVFDPQKPELEFYNTQSSIEKIHHIEKPRKKNIFRSRAFIIGYGIFLLITVSTITMYQKRNINMPVLSSISKSVKSYDLNIKVNDVEIFTDKVKATIEIGNKKYKDDDNSIETLTAYTILSSNKIVIASNYNIYNNVRFKNNERIGYSSTFNKNAWQSSDTIYIKLDLDSKRTFEKNINTHPLKFKNNKL